MHLYTQLSNIFTEIWYKPLLIVINSQIKKKKDKLRKLSFYNVFPLKFTTLISI